MHLHSTVVLLKPGIISAIGELFNYLHSTVVLLKPKVLLVFVFL